MNLVNKMLTVHTWGSQFDPQHPLKRQNKVFVILVLGMADTNPQSSLAIQSNHLESFRKIPNINLWLTHTYTYNQAHICPSMHIHIQVRQTLDANPTCVCAHTYTKNNNNLLIWEGHNTNLLILVGDLGQWFLTSVYILVRGKALGQTPAMTFYPSLDFQLSLSSHMWSKDWDCLFF